LDKLNTYKSREALRNTPSATRRVIYIKAQKHIQLSAGAVKKSKKEDTTLIVAISVRIAKVRARRRQSE